MTAVLVVALLCIVALVLRQLFRDSSAGPGYSAPPPGRPPTLRPSPPSRPRFSGRVVEPEPFVTRPPARAARPRMTNGRKMTAVKNGRTVIPPDAIGLGCLQPISECSLGDRCVCLSQNELRVRSRL